MQALTAALVVDPANGGYALQRNLCCMIQLCQEAAITSDIGQAGVDVKLAASPYDVHAGPPLPDTCYATKAYQVRRDCSHKQSVPAERLPTHGHRHSSSEDGRIAHRTFSCERHMSMSFPSLDTNSDVSNLEPWPDTEGSAAVLGAAGPCRR